jgi:phosphatidylinositol-3-phosphatase
MNFARTASALAVALMALTAPLSAATTAPPPIRHVFVIVLENENVGTTFGQNTPSPYLSLELPKQGAILLHYFGTGHWSNDNYLSMISGQAPNNETQNDCQVYSDFRSDKFGEYGQLLGSGCVFPSSVSTVANQLDSAHLTWKGYMEDMGNDPQREAATCGRPQLGQKDGTQKAEAPSDRVPNGDQYASRHDPFVYFHSIVDDTALCNSRVVPLTGLDADLRSADATPNLAYIVPNLCHDGHDAPCKNGEPGGLISADQFLKHWVPLITASPAFKKDGLLVVTFDESELVYRGDPDGGNETFGGDSSACCNERAPNVEHAGILGPGGGYIGAVALSPFINAGTVSSIAYNHYSLLRTIETIFGLSPLGYAGQPEVVPFGDDVFTKR